MDKVGVSTDDQIQGLEKEVKKIDDMLNSGIFVKTGSTKAIELTKMKESFQQQIDELKSLKTLV